MSAIVPLKRAVKSTLTAISHWRVPRVEPIIVKTMEHDTAAFTQGLAHCGGHLYESTGGETNSMLRRLNADSGCVEAVVSIHDDYAEGIAIVDDRLFQLSWKSGTVREYRVPNLELIGEHRHRGERWGLATCHGRLLASDGSSQLRFFDTCFQPRDALNITSNGIPVRWLNDLECVDDRVYANLVASHFILEISLATGRVRRLIDCHKLVAIESPKSAPLDA